MTNNQLTEEELQTLIIELQQTAYRLNGTNSAYLMSDAIKPLRELQERRKAAIDSEPVAWLAIYHGEVYDEAIGISRSVVEAQADHFGWESALTEIIPLYRHAQQPVTGEPDHQLCKKCNDGLRGGCSACSFSADNPVAAGLVEIYVWGS
ncbi:hypothetical protein R8547_16110 [Klebsiella oxytoca]|uniref:hypothetical protein n=1 Tax=Klebsiella oxytoca TaxID=571 RepID=UPI0029CA7CD1|nr:hypothetical protein [Klebsiella oxytoca]WPI51624.1 hypothetical protein R8547_16110 [Klebsiella oxytoca]